MGIIRIFMLAKSFAAAIPLIRVEFIYSYLKLYIYI